MPAETLPGRRLDLSARLVECARDRTLVSVQLARDKELDGCFVAESGELGLLRVDLDWEKDGWALIDVSAASKLVERHRGFNEFAKRIGQRRRCSRPPCNPADGWRACLEALRAREVLIETHKRNSTGFRLGRIKRVGRDSLWLAGVDSRGVWEPTATKLRFDSLAFVAWESRYARGFERILRLHGGLPVRRPASHRFDTRGPRAIANVLRDALGREQQITLSLRGRDDREQRGCVIEIGRDYVLIAKSGRVAFDGWILVRRAEITRVQRTRLDAKDDFARARLGLCATHPPFQFKSFIGALRALHRLGELCALRKTPAGSRVPYTQYGRIERLSEGSIRTTSLGLSGTLLLSSAWSQRLAEFSAVEFGTKYLSHYQENLIVSPKRRAKA